MRNYIFFVFVFCAQFVFSQRKIESSDSLFITGYLELEFALSLHDLNKFEIHTIPDILITNQEGEIKSKRTNWKGVLVKDLLSKSNFRNVKTKELNEIYFVMLATDGYKVVFSWNEIFNNELGNSIFIVTEENGKSLFEMENRIILVCPTDIKTGKRFIKGLRNIIVKRDGF